MFISKNVKCWKNPNLVYTELPSHGGDNDEGDDDEVDGGNKDVGLDNVNAVDGENKVDLGDVYDGGGESNDDVGVDDVGGVNINGGDDADFGNSDSKFHCGEDRGRSGDGGIDNGGIDDDSDAAYNIGNDTNCGDGKSKVDCSKDTAVDVSNSKSNGGGDTNDDDKGGDDSDGEGNQCVDGHKNDDDDRCLNSAKNYFKSKQIVLENFSLPVSAKWRRSL